MKCQVGGLNPGKTLCFFGFLCRFCSCVFFSLAPQLISQPRSSRTSYVYVYDVLSLLLCLLLVVVIVHLTPKVFFIQITALTANLRCTSENTSVHSLVVRSLLCGLELFLYYTSHSHYGHTRSRRLASARSGEYPLVHTMV